VDPGELPGYDYDYINADVITHSLAAGNGKLVLPSGQSYRVMLLPDRDDISLEVLRSLEKLVFNGAVVIGRKPERATSLKDYPGCDAEVKTIAGKLWGRCDGEKIFSNSYGNGRIYWGKSVKEVLEELKIPPDFEVKGIDNADWHIDYIHRRTESEDIYFVSNNSPMEEEVTCVFRVDKNRVPEIWDAESGLIQREVAYAKVENGIRMEFILDPLASRFVVFRDKSTGMNDAGLHCDLQFGFNPTEEAEGIGKTIDLTSNWVVSFDPAMGGAESHRLERLISWTETDQEGIRYYSGKASYSRDFTVDEKALSKNAEAFAVFGDIQEMARVFVNGKDCGIVWTPPYKARITPCLQAGTNHISVEVINTWNNRIVGDIRNPDQKPYTSTNVRVRFNEDSPLLKSGLTGTAAIIFTN
jgi:hypothetical protein